MTKTYRLRGRRVVEAVDDLTFEVHRGQIFGFLGPNGAGKTTTIKMLLGFVSPTSGTARIFGTRIDQPEARRQVGYLAEQASFHPFLSPQEALAVHAAILGLPRREALSEIGGLLERVGIADRADRPIGKLSKGMSQRLALATALLGDPDLLILDEPGSGLDPIGRRDLRTLLIRLKGDGKTVFLSSHLLTEVEAICDTVAMLNEGRLVALGPPARIKQGASRLKIVVAGMRTEMEGLPESATVQVNTGDSTTHIEVERNECYAALRALDAVDAPLLGVEECTESLEDAFVRLAA